MAQELRWLIDGYEEWLRGEDVDIVTGLAVDLMSVETKVWPRFDVPAAVVHLDARGDFCDMHLIDIPPAGKCSPQRHLYEEVVYVLDGTGSTVMENSKGEKRSFEWGTGSLFAVPLNMKYQHFNASGQKKARLAQTTTLPTIMKLFRDEEFVFDADHDFTQRIGGDNYFTGSGTFNPIRDHRHFWETNFVPDLRSFAELRDAPSRGKNSTNIHFVLAESTMHAHVSEIPVGLYKKAHKHAEGYHIIMLSGEGYSTYWNDQDNVTRVEWTYGLLHSPSREMWHQHFNTGNVPARYMAAAMGGIRYPFLRERLERWREAKTEDQIEYEDEDPKVMADFEEAKRASAMRMAASGGVPSEQGA